MLAFVLQAVLDLGSVAVDGPVNWSLNVPEFNGFVDVPDFGLLGNFNLLGSWENAGVVTVVVADPSS